MLYRDLRSQMIWPLLWITGPVPGMHQSQEVMLSLQPPQSLIWHAETIHNNSGNNTSYINALYDPHRKEFCGNSVQSRRPRTSLIQVEQPVLYMCHWLRIYFCQCCSTKCVPFALLQLHGTTGAKDLKHYKVKGSHGSFAIDGTQFPKFQSVSI